MQNFYEKFNESESSRQQPTSKKVDQTFSSIESSEALPRKKIAKVSKRQTDSQIKSTGESLYKRFKEQQKDSANNTLQKDSPFN